MDEYDRRVIGVVARNQLVTFRRVCRDDRGTGRDLLRDVAVRVERLEEDFPGPIVRWFYVWSSAVAMSRSSRLRRIESVGPPR
jgi:hypothetical protein